MAIYISPLTCPAAWVMTDLEAGPFQHHPAPPGPLLLSQISSFYTANPCGGNNMEAFILTWHGRNEKNCWELQQLNFLAHQVVLNSLFPHLRTSHWSLSLYLSEVPLLLTSFNCAAGCSDGELVQKLHKPPATGAFYVFTCPYCASQIPSGKHWNYLLI